MWCITLINLQILKNLCIPGGTRDQIVNLHWIIRKAREYQKKIYFCFIGYTKAFDCVDHKKLWKILQEMGILDHRTYLPPEKSVCRSGCNS